MGCLVKTTTVEVNNTYKLNFPNFLRRRKQNVFHEKDFLVLKLHLETQLNILLFCSIRKVH